MPKNKTKTDLKKLIKRANHLPNSEIKKWLLIIEYLNMDELQDTYKYFEKINKDKEEFQLKLIFKNKLESEYMEKIDEVSRKYKKKATNNEEKFISETSENPEEVLKKIDKA